MWLVRLPWYVFWSVLIVLKLGFAEWLPLIGDESYFSDWARHLDWGYYDHGPATAWMIAPFVWAFKSRWAVRLVELLLSLLWPLLTYFAESTADDTNRSLRARTLALLPLPAAIPILMTDTPLQFGCMLILLGGTIASRNPRSWWTALLPLGVLLAALSKYLFVLYLPGVAIFLIWKIYDARATGGSQAWIKLSLATLLALTLGCATQVLWNLNHCLATFTFNVATRHRATTGLALANLGLFALFQLLIWNPVGILAIFWERPKLQLSRHLLPLGMGLLALGILFAISIVSVPSLHWQIPFTYPVILWALLSLSHKNLVRWLNTNALLTAVLFGLQTFMALGPDSWFVHPPIFRGYNLESIVYFRKPEQVARVAQERLTQAQHASSAPVHLIGPGYSAMSLLSFELYHRGIDVPIGIIGRGSVFGRQYDFLTPAAEWEGHSLLYFGQDRKTFEDYAQYFSSVDWQPYTVNGVTLWSALGVGFRAADYVREVVPGIARDFYPLRAHSRSCKIYGVETRDLE